VPKVDFKVSVFILKNRFVGKGPPILIKFGIAIHLRSQTNSLELFFKILKIAYFTGVSNLIKK